jgi:hypothetical protein
MAKTNTERGVLKQALEAVGLRLREQRNTYTVDVDPGKDAIAVRARLQKIGIDATSLAKRLNAGESVLITTSITALPLPLSPDVWSSVVFERSVPEKTLFATIVRDRRASLLYYGLHHRARHSQPRASHDAAGCRQGRTRGCTVHRADRLPARRNTGCPRLRPTGWRRQVVGRIDDRHVPSSHIRRVASKQGR